MIPAHVPKDRVVDLDLFNDPGLKTDLHRKLSSLHSDHPDLFYTPRNEGHWVVTNLSLASLVLGDYEHFSSSEGSIPRPSKPLPMIPLTLDPPASLPYRTALMRYFGPRSIKERESEIRALAVTLIDGVAGRGGCEFLRSVGAALPVTVFMNMMGLPLARFDEFRDLVVEYFAPISDQRRLELYEVIRLEISSVVADRRREPGDDLVSGLARETIEGRPFSTEDLESICMLLFVAGMDTVANAVTFMFYYLAKDPVLQRSLIDDPRLIPGFIEESLRMYGVVNIPRLVTRDVELDGVRLLPGDMILCMLSVAGRDEEVAADANHFNASRPEHPHVGFGYGPHVCAGQHLARLEMKVLLEEWIKRIPAFSVPSGFVPEFRSWIVLALNRLPLHWST